jgi:iron complex outermembrane recepter protein
MRGKLTLLAGVFAGAISFPAFAQDAADDAADSTEIIVTAQRTDQRLQDVPIAVSAFNTEALDKQQIKNTSDLQLTLPNVTFTKTQFTSSSFTIRGIGDLCVGTTCDSATAIHMNDAPLFGTRLFESEFYDMAQIEVLRGPQGTLFGKNATSGVVNFRTTKPSLSGLAASAEAEYGNYNSVKLKGMVNVPVADIAAVRLAGFYLNRDGYTKNLFDNSKIDDRDMYGLRGSIRIEPGSGTEINIMAQYFHEKDNRMRSQKQLCQRDVTGIMGCLNARLDYAHPNGNATFPAGILTSREFLAINGGAAAAAFGLNSLYGPDYYNGVVNPADPRVVNSDFTPTYFTEEWIVQGSIEQELGNGLSLKVMGNFQDVKVDSSQDTGLGVLNRATFATGLGTLAAVAGTPAHPLYNYLRPIAAALIPNGPAGVLCTSLPEPSLTGAFGANGGQKICGNTPIDLDRSVQSQSSWSAEAIISSDWDSKFNFLLGGIYGKFHMTENSYYVNSFGIDYAAGILGALSAFANGIPASATSGYFLASPGFRSNTDDLKITTYGIFGEAYYQFNDQLKLTLGLRYNSDKKDIRARTTTLNFLSPTGASQAFDSPFAARFDADLSTACPPGSPVGTVGSVPGCDAFQVRGVSFKEWTGRAVLDYAITPDNLVYLSYSRGYKSGGINPPLSPIFAVSDSFKPEFVDAFEIGSKNQFGKIQLNLTGFYYKYKDLQLSRIVARTSVNDNVSATIYGLEAEAVLRPTDELTLNVNASYLNTKVSQDKFLSNPRDFGGGRADAVIIKDATNGSNCAVSSNTGSAPNVNAFVNQVNTIINGGIPGVQPGANLQPTTPFASDSGLASTGAFSICAVLQSLAPTLGAAFGGITFGTPGSNSPGIDVNIKGNKLPGAPDTKFSAGIQYAASLGEMTLTPRADFVYTGKSYGNIFNGVVNRVPSFTQVNAQLQLDGPDKKWFARAWVQNVFDKDSITGLYLGDQSQGAFTNIFTLEPRRFGVTAGIKF